MNCMTDGKAATGRAATDRRARLLVSLSAVLLPLCSAGALAQNNLAPSGIAYLWAHNPTATASTNQVAAPGLNDGNTAVDVKLNDGSGETATLYEGDANANDLGIAFSESDCH